LITGFVGCRSSHSLYPTLLYLSPPATLIDLHNISCRKTLTFHSNSLLLS
jgi:hypothetical protein